MLPFFWYMLKVIICSGILFGYYWLFLRNKIFHRYNRFYLLTAISLSLLLPLLKINFWQPAAQQNQAIRVLQAVSVGDEYMNNMVITAQKSNWSFEQLYPMIYLFVSIIFLLLMIRTLYLIRTLLKRYPVQQIEQVSFVNTEDDSTPFTFLKYIFWNSSIDMDTTTGRQIFKHEVAHIEEKHTHDKLFVNMVLIFCWCNPFFWLYRKELNMIHEFIADKKAVEGSDTSAFAAMILQAAYPKHRFELTNNFFYSPIKRRLRMLTKNKNPKMSYIARLMVLPLAVLIFAAFTFKAKTNNSLYHDKKINVVIDAGHGGKDLGASSTDGVFEKDLTLAIAKKVKELNTNDAIEIILVRDDDVYMSATEKIGFTKIKNADLFISFHVDNGPKESADKSTGMSCSVAKDEFSNAGQSKVLASAIVDEFNNNYGLPVMRQLKQRKVGVLTLQGNVCPAVLIETGFINNEKDKAYLQTEAAKKTIAQNLLSAIEKYLLNKPVERRKSIDTLPAAQKQLLTINDTAARNAILGKKLQNLDMQQLKQKILIEQQAKERSDYEEQEKIVLGQKLNDLKIQNLKQKMLAEQQALTKLDYAEKEKIVMGRKLNDQEIQNIKQKMLVEQQALAKLEYTEKEKIAMGRKLNDLEIQNLKQKMLVEQEALAKLDYAEKEKTVMSKKLNELEIQKIKQKMMLEEQALAKQNYAESLARAKEKYIASEKEMTTQKELLLQQDNIVFIKAEVNPQFTGGDEAWAKYLRENLKASTPVDEGWKAGKYMVIVKFIVHADGTVSDVTTENYKGSKTAQHCIDVIMKTPKWQPAVQNGRKVNAYKKQPITFVIEE